MRIVSVMPSSNQLFPWCKPNDFNDPSGCLKLKQIGFCIILGFKNGGLGDVKKEPFDLSLSLQKIQRDTSMELGKYYEKLIKGITFSPQKPRKKI